VTFAANTDSVLRQTTFEKEPLGSSSWLLPVLEELHHEAALLVDVRSIGPHRNRCPYCARAIGHYRSAHSWLAIPSRQLGFGEGLSHLNQLDSCLYDPFTDRVGVLASRRPHC